MATIQQIDANRRNAQQSTGPRTPEGKQSSSRNALKSGIYAQAEVLFTERREDLEALTAEYYERFQPTTPEARDLVDSLIRNAWLLRRFAAAEAAVFNSQHEGNLDDATRISYRLHNAVARLDLLQRRINSTERNYHRSLKALQALPAPEPDPQPVAAETPSPKLASFPQNPNLPAPALQSSSPDPVPGPPDPPNQLH